MLILYHLVLHIFIGQVYCNKAGGKKQSTINCVTEIIYYSSAGWEVQDQDVGTFSVW